MSAVSEERTVTREIQVKLTISELADLAQKSGQLSSDLIGLKSEFDAAKKDWKGKIGAIEADLAETHKQQHSGSVTRLAECREVKDFEGNTVRYFHGEDMIEERAMTGEERQADMFHPEVLDKEEVNDDVLNGDDIKDVMDAETSRDKVGMLEAPVIQ